jgi:hypothetical protein
MAGPPWAVRRRDGFCGDRGLSPCAQKLYHYTNKQAPHRESRARPPHKTCAAIHRRSGAGPTPHIHAQLSAQYTHTPSMGMPTGGAPRKREHVSGKRTRPSKFTRSSRGRSATRCVLECVTSAERIPAASEERGPRQTHGRAFGEVGPGRAFGEVGRCVRSRGDAPPVELAQVDGGLCFVDEPIDLR